MARSVRILLLVTMLGTACGADTGSAGQPVPDPTTPLRATAPDQVTPVAATPELGPQDACPVTVPPQPGFVPPEPYPSKAPAVEQGVWYGTAALWTILGPEGEVWEGLPRSGGIFSNKTLWWSQGYSPIDEPTPLVTVTSRQLDGPGWFEVREPGTNGFRGDYGSFMLAGASFPTTGCWELTARYGDTELTYVVSVKR